MKDYFDKFFEMLLKREGGFVNDPEDPGGATNLSVMRRVVQKFLGRVISIGEIRALTPEDVKPVYKKLCADKVNFYDLPAGLDWAALDWALNNGTGKAAEALQKIIGAKLDDAIGFKDAASRGKL